MCTRRPDSRKQILENVSATGYRLWTYASSLTFNNNREWKFPQPLYLQAQGNLPVAVTGEYYNIIIEFYFFACENVSQNNLISPGLTEQCRVECSTLESWAQVLLAAATELKETEVYDSGCSMETRIINQCLGQAYVSPGWYIGLEKTSLFPKVRYDTVFFPD